MADEEDKLHDHVDNVEENPLPPLLKDLTLAELTEKDCNIFGEEMGNVSPKYTMDTPVQTPCGHMFGYKCIRSWLLESRFPTFPMCRSPFSSRRHQFPEGIDDHEDDGRVPHDWLNILMEAANSERPLAVISAADVRTEEELAGVEQDS